MKKSLALLAVLGCFSQSSMATTTTLASTKAAWTAAGQSGFHSFAEEFGAALSYKPVTPAAPLGITGFDIGLEASSTAMTTDAKTAWQNLIPGTSAPSSIVVPKLYVAKGLPFDIDVAAFISAIPTTSISLTGVAISYAIIGGGVALPAVTIRGAYTNLNGIDQLSFNTKSLDISISKGFLGFTPYAGVGEVWVSSSTTNTYAQQAGITSESFNQPKVYVGLNINLGLPNLALEADTTGGISTYSAKLGLRW
jgi:hypothetical protein